VWRGLSGSGKKASLRHLLEDCNSQEELVVPLEDLKYLTVKLWISDVGWHAARSKTNRYSENWL